MRRLWIVLVLAAGPALADDTASYQRPPASIAKLVDAPPIPQSVLGPDRKTLLLVTPRVFPSIAEVSEPELRLAGLRINPKNRAASRRSFAQKLELLDTAKSGAQPQLVRGLPADARIANVMWSPSGDRVAFTLTLADRVELWVVDVAQASAKRLSQASVAAAIGAPCAWLPRPGGSDELICRTVVQGMSAPPIAPTVPTGPIVQENAGQKKPARTNPDLLQNPTDEKLLEYYLYAQIDRIGSDGIPRLVAKPGLYTDVTPSPDGERLLVTSIHRPFSYRVDIGNFPTRTDVIESSGKLVATIADLKLAEDVPVDFDAVRTGRREIDWREDAPGTVCWVEAADGGDVKKPAAIRDNVECAARTAAGDPSAKPFTKPARIAQLALRYRGVAWGTDAHGVAVALVTEGWWKDRKTRTWLAQPDGPAKPHILWDRSSEDRYTDPGRPVMRQRKPWRHVLHVTGDNQLLLIGAGASDQGDRPFFDKLDLATGKTTRVWRSDGQRYATVTDVIDVEGDDVLISRESPTEVPQLYAHAFSTKAERQLTRLAHPVPELAKVKKQLFKWKRKDGLELSALMYLPAGFRPKQDAPLPVLVWSYPREFKTAQAASQVQSSPYRFVYPYWGGPLFALLLGYAVVDEPAFAIVGEGKAEPNDSYVQQLTDDAASMIDAVVAMGVGDRNRFAIAGHSYGAFTTANLLAHSKLFATGIARSGAYNRTLTPFGFQSEERTYWEAAEVYDRMSPFRFAREIDAPLLLIHGAADNNPGTFPIQSDRLFAAMQGLGKTVRFVSLPAEAHGYRARESALHVLWEQARWLDAHLKNAKPRR